MYFNSLPSDHLGLSELNTMDKIEFNYRLLEEHLKSMDPEQAKVQDMVNKGLEIHNKVNKNVRERDNNTS